MDVTSYERVLWWNSEAIRLWWDLTLTFNLESYFSVSARPDTPVWETSTRHAANAVRTSPYFSDRGWQRAICAAVDRV